VKAGVVAGIVATGGDVAGAGAITLESGHYKNAIEEKQNKESKKK
jgi:hypothetical protein